MISILYIWRRMQDKHAGILISITEQKIKLKRRKRDVQENHSPKLWRYFYTNAAKSFPSRLEELEENALRN